MHVLLSHYQDITFKEQFQIPKGCISIYIKTKYWKCTSKFETVNANPSAFWGGGRGGGEGEILGELTKEELNLLLFDSATLLHKHISR